jgi:transcriptional regulator with XRE-family HTH domain
MVEAKPPTLESVRRERGLTQEQLARELGLRSKGYISRLENGEKPFSLEIALRAEIWSGGLLSADELVDGEERELLAAYRRQVLETAEPDEARA